MRTCSSLDRPIFFGRVFLECLFLFALLLLLQSLLSDFPYFDFHFGFNLAVSLVFCLITLIDLDDQNLFH